MTKFLSVFLLLTLSLGAWSKRFSNQYCEFELPSGWVCALEGAEWVCQSENADRKKESIIILAAKVRGEQDNYDEYLTYLKKPKEFSLPGGKKQISEAKYAKTTEINGHRWVDSLHLASEVPGFYTRYLATVKEDLGIAVTFSVTKDLYNQYLPVIDKLASTLRVFRQRKQELADLRGQSNQDPNFNDATFSPTSSFDLTANRTKKRAGSGDGGDNTFLFIILGLAAVVFIIIKKKKK